MSEKIESLTPEQEARFDEYVERYVKIGLTTATGPKQAPAELRPVVDACYAAAEPPIPPPHLVISVGGGPASALLALRALQDMADIRAVDEVAFGDEIDARASAMGADALQAMVAAAGSADFCFGQHDAGRFAWYAYFKEVVGLVEETAPAAALMRTAGWGWWLAHKNVAIVSRPPVELHLLPDGNMHRDGGPAALYADGWGVYVLNGVNVPQWLAVTPEEQLDPRMLARIDNAEVRREFVRKIGIDRLCHSLDSKTLDEETVKLESGQQVEYTLLALKVHADQPAREYLKMKNPSELTWHVEGVPPGTKSVREALAFRNGTDRLPHSIT